MNIFTVIIFCIAPALILAALIYLPYFAKRPRPVWPALRHVACIALILYCAVLAYLVFGIYSELNTEAPLLRSLSLFPFTEVAKQYMQGLSLVDSQYIMNILLFVPMGLALPIVFPRCMGRCWQTLLTALAVTVTIEAVQYFIGRSADIDDVIANVIGGLCGYALYYLGTAIFYNTGLRRRMLPDAARPRPYAVALLSLCLALTIAAPPVLDALDAGSEYGLLRYSSHYIPANAVCTAELSVESPESGGVYLPEDVDEHALLNELAAQFCPGVELSSHDSWNEYYGRSVWAENEAENVLIDVYQNGTFYAGLPAETDEQRELTDGEFLRFATGLAGEFLREGETLAATPPVTENGERSVEVTYHSDDPNVYISGSTRITLREGTVFIGAYTERCHKVTDAALISPAEAYAATHGLSADAFRLSDYNITRVELATCRIRGKYLPAYVFSGTARLEEGQQIEFSSVVEAIRR